MSLSTISISLKKSIKIVLISSILFLASSTLYGKWYSVSTSDTPKPIDVSVVKSDIESTILKVTVFGFESEKISIDDREFSTISIPDLSTTDQKGLPEVPRFSKNILIPANSTPSVHVIDYKMTSYDLGAIAPSKGVIMRDVNPNDISYTFSSFYSSDQTFPSEFVKISSPFTLRNTHGVTVEILPIQYNHMLNQTNVFILAAFKADRIVRQ